jgi:plastocyanin
MKTVKTLFVSLLGLLCFFLYFNGYLLPKSNSGVKTHTVEIVQMKFKPAELMVNKGDKVVFINHDMVTHNVTESTGKSWKSPDIPTGKSWSMVVAKNANYYCTFHPVMKGKILVKQ